MIKGLVRLTKSLSPLPEVIAGTSTAGIPHGAALARELKLLFIYIRDKPKVHGLTNRIEGVPGEKGLQGKRVLVIEDALSRGGSSASAVDAVREAGGIVEDCISLFSYNFPEAREILSGKAAYTEDKKLSAPCRIHSLLTYPLLLKVGIEHGYIKEKEQTLLEKWYADPKAWNDTFEQNNRV